MTPALIRSVLALTRRTITPFVFAALAFVPQGAFPSDVVDALYRSFGTARLWIEGGRPSATAQAVFSALRYARLEGLEPQYYHVDALETLWSTTSPRELDDLDRQLTRSLLDYADDVRFGRLYRAGAAEEPVPLASRNLSEAEQLVTEVRQSDDPFSYLVGLSPQHRYYQGLKRALSGYRRLQARGGWPTVPKGPTIRPGDAEVRVPALRQRLAAEGDFTGEVTASTLYDETLVAAVTRFQQRHGLEADGLVGRVTQEELATTVADRIRLVELNMERWRQASRSLGRRYVLVDIAGFTLRAIEDDQVRLEMRVIVGTPYNQTPVFSSAIDHLVVNPFWNVPASIARNEMLPELIRDPAYLVQNHFRLLQNVNGKFVEVDSTTVDWPAIGRGIARYRIRQDPGPWNALGSVKFVLPNRYDVYLHDTPHQGLFGLSSRALSHGCIRLARPLDLAAFALGAQSDNETLARVNALIESGERQVLKLDPVLPVHVVYLTAWVDSDGTIRFNRDLYGRDSTLAASLKR